MGVRVVLYGFKMDVASAMKTCAKGSFISLSAYLLAVTLHAWCGVGRGVGAWEWSAVEKVILLF